MATNFNLTDISDAFKERFQGTMLLQYNNADILRARIKKTYNFLGKKDYRGIDLAAGVGFATNELPEVSHGAESYDQAEITAKNVYCMVEVAREAIKAGMNSEGIFDASTLEHVAEKAIKGTNRHLNRILYGAGDGSLYTGNASNTNVSGSGASCDPYVINADGDADEFNKFYFEVNDKVSINSESTVLEVVARTANSVSLVGTSTRLAALTGANPFTTTDDVYAQKSKDGDPTGLGILANTTGSSYGVSHTNDRWQGNIIQAAGQGISEDLLNELILTIEEESGETPDLITCSYLQYRKIKDFMGDLKRVKVEPRDEGLRGLVSFSALAFDSSAGLIPIMADKMVKKDRVYAINTNKIEALHRPDWGWFDDGGPVFKTRDASDRLQARFGGYMEYFIQPNFHGYIDELATA